MTTAPDPPQLRTVLALRQLGSALAATNRAVGGALGIKDTDLAVLDVLHQEGPLTPTQLARRTRTHPATMTGVLGRLERGGWIERRPDAADRRSVRIPPRGGRIPGGFKARPGDTASPVAAAAAGKKADPHPGCPPTPVGRGVGVGAPMLMP